MPSQSNTSSIIHLRNPLSCWPTSSPVYTDKNDWDAFLCKKQDQKCPKELQSYFSFLFLPPFKSAIISQEVLWKYIAHSCIIVIRFCIITEGLQSTEWVSQVALTKFYFICIAIIVSLFLSAGLIIYNCLFFYCKSDKQLSNIYTDHGMNKEMHKTKVFCSWLNWDYICKSEGII